MQLRRRQGATLDLSVTRFRDVHVDRRLRNTMALKVRLKETSRTFSCFEDGYMNLKTVTEVPTTEKLEAFSLDAFLSLELSSKVIGSVLHGSFSDERKERYFEGLISYIAHERAKDAVASEVDSTVALKAEFEVTTDIFEPSERCMVCLVEFWPWQVVKRKPCGHTYHDGCMEYYIKRNIDCPTCYYKLESSLKSSSGATKFASEEDIIKVSRDFSNTDDDDESEEESFDEPGEMCMVCLVEFQPRDVVERKPCGHTYHEDCMEYYIKHNIDCPTCHYDEPESSSKSRSGARELASEEDIIKMFCDSLNIDETEEEGSDKSSEMCRVSCGFCNIDDDDIEEGSSNKSGVMCTASCDFCNIDDDDIEERSSNESGVMFTVPCGFCNIDDDDIEEGSFNESRMMCTASCGFCNIEDDDIEEGSSNESGVTCMVCGLEFRPGEMMKRMPCGHVYHEDCVDYYIERDIECPMCNHDTSF